MLRRFTLFAVSLFLLVILGCGGSSTGIGKSPVGLYKATYFTLGTMLIAVNGDRTVDLAVLDNGKFIAFGTGHLTVENTFAVPFTYFKGDFREVRGTIDGAGANREVFGLLFNQGDRSSSFYGTYVHEPLLAPFVGHYDSPASSENQLGPVAGDVDNKGNFVGTFTVGGVATALTGTVSPSGGLHLTGTANGYAYNLNAAADLSVPGKCAFVGASLAYNNTLNNYQVNYWRTDSVVPE